MSNPFNSNDVLSKSKNQMMDDDEDSLLELGQIAILGASRPSLKYYKSTSEMNASKKSLTSRNMASNLNNSRFLFNNFGSKNESILAASVEEAAMVDKGDQIIKPEEEEKEAIKPDSDDFCLYFSNLKGYIYGIISALIFVLSQVIMRRSIWLSGPDHVFIRLFLALVIFLTYLKYKKLNVLGPKKQFQLLMLRGFLGK